MKTVHIIFSLNTGGAEAMLVDILNEQVKTQSVYLIVINNLFNQDLLNKVKNKVRIILIGRTENSKNILPILKLNVSLFKIKPDVIHCHHQSIIKLLFKRKNAVLTLHTTGINVNNLYKYHRVFAISKAVIKDIQSKSNVQTKLIYNGVKTEDILEKSNYDFKTFKIVQIGRLNHYKKGQHLLIEALDILINKKGMENIRVDFIGEALFPEILVFLKKKVLELKLNRFIRFLGNKDRSYVYSHLKNYNLLVQPSLFEGFGLTVVEAMSARVPVLVSDIEGPMEIINNGVYGEFFKNNNVQELSNKINEIISNYSYLIDKTKIAKLHVDTKFNTKKMVENYNLNYL